MINGNSSDCWNAIFGSLSCEVRGCVAKMKARRAISCTTISIQSADWAGFFFVLRDFVNEGSQHKADEHNDHGWMSDIYYISLSTLLSPCPWRGCLFLCCFKIFVRSSNCLSSGAILPRRGSSSIALKHIRCQSQGSGDRSSRESWELSPRL